MFDPTYLLVIIGSVFCIITSLCVNSAMKKYSKIAASSGLTGSVAAQSILRGAGIMDVRVECLNKDDGDHYDPSSKAVRLSRGNYDNASITSIAVAAHECGHAAQHNQGYMPIKVRTAIVPLVNVSNYLWLPILLLGIFFSYNETLIHIGIIVFSVVVGFQIVTLPVELNASNRAMQIMEQEHLLVGDELKGARKVLTAAAMKGAPKNACIFGERRSSGAVGAFACFFRRKRQ